MKPKRNQGTKRGQYNDFMLDALALLGVAWHRFGGPPPLLLFCSSPLRLHTHIHMSCLHRGITSSFYLTLVSPFFCSFFILSCFFCLPHHPATVHFCPIFHPTIKNKGVKSEEEKTSKYKIRSIKKKENNNINIKIKIKSSISSR